MPAAHFLGLRPRLVFAQYPDDLLLAEATPFHRPSPFSGDGLYLISAEFSGCRPKGQGYLAERYEETAPQKTKNSTLEIIKNVDCREDSADSTHQQPGFPMFWRGRRDKKCRSKDGEG